jgi:ABC-type sugar transport system substrate-binding protein
VSRRRCLRLAALLALAAAGALCAGAAQAGEPKPLRVTIAVTGDVSGYLEPCG